MNQDRPKKPKPTKPKKQMKTGRGWKYEGHTQRVNLTLDPEVIEEAKELLQGSGRSVSDVVNELLKLRVEAMKRKGGQ